MVPRVAVAVAAVRGPVRQVGGPVGLEGGLVVRMFMDLVGRLA